MKLSADDRHSLFSSQTALITMNASPELLRRIDRLSGCQGHWLLIRDGEPAIDYSHNWHQDYEEHLQTCLAEKWRNVSLAFVPSYCGYSDYSNTGLVGLANYNCLYDPSQKIHPAVHDLSYGWNGRGIALDVLLVDDNILDTICALEDYPLISEDEHSYVECFGIGKLWADEPIRERVRMLQDLGLCVFMARRDSAPWEADRLRDSLVETLNEYPTIAAG